MSDRKAPNSYDTWLRLSPHGKLTATIPAPEIGRLEAVIAGCQSIADRGCQCGESDAYRLLEELVQYHEALRAHYLPNKAVQP